MKRPLLEQLLALRAAGTAAVLITDPRTGRQFLLSEGDGIGDLPIDGGLRAMAGEALAADRSGLCDTPAGPLFLRVYSPPLRLIIVGAVQIALPLSRIAALCGYAVTLIDPRSRFAAREMFAGCQVIDDWPDAALPGLRPDRRTAVVTLTHDPKLDDAALGAALATPAFYIGALGSRRSHQARLQRLTARGVAPERLQCVRGPVGLDIGARSAAEIAVAIIAEITETLRHGRAARWTADAAADSAAGTDAGTDG
jgi:xanthine dehydrogenase accessory factor